MISWDLRWSADRIALFLFKYLYHNTQASSRTSNYHLFDALRGGMHAKLSKKSGHYIGKLRRDKDKPVGCYTLYNASREKQELAAFVYDVPALMQQVKEGQPPRRMQAVIPKSTLLTSTGSDEKTDTEMSHSTIKHTNPYDRANTSRLIEHLHNGTWKHQRLLAVQTKPPKFHEGMYLSAACFHTIFQFAQKRCRFSAPLCFQRFIKNKASIV